MNLKDAFIFLLNGSKLIKIDIYFYLIHIKMNTVLAVINQNTSLVKMSLRKLVTTINNWDENRTLDDNKVKEILKGYENKDITLLTSQFRVATYPNGQQILIDGHHRKEAASEFLLKYPKFDENIDIFVIIHDKTNDIDIYDLHIKANLCTPLKEEQKPNSKRSALITAFKNDAILGNGISKNRCTKAHQPRMSVNELAELSGEIIIKYPYLEIEVIIYNIKIINNRLCLLFTADNLPILFGSNRIREDIVEKAHKYKFYLNIRDSYFNKDKWIEFITEPSSISISNVE
jgi:hypothetical protein